MLVCAATVFYVETLLYIINKWNVLVHSTSMCCNRIFGPGYVAMDVKEMCCNIGTTSIHSTI